uniref:Uncharacterized protein n=1 Tax=Pongo abelii TaxID=9601 RepID=H2PHT8_PONAB
MPELKSCEAGVRKYNANNKQQRVTHHTLRQLCIMSLSCRQGRVIKAKINTHTYTKIKVKSQRGQSVSNKYHQGLI